MITNLMKIVYVNTKVREKPRNTTNFNQKFKMLKDIEFSLRYRDVTLSKLYYNILEYLELHMLKRC